MLVGFVESLLWFEIFGSCQKHKAIGISTIVKMDEIFIVKLLAVSESDNNT